MSSSSLSTVPTIVPTSTSSKSTSTTTPSIRVVPIDPATLRTLAHVGYTAFFDFSVSVAQPPEFPSVESYHDALLAELDKVETFHLMAVRDGDKSQDSRHYVEGVGEVLGSVLMDCASEVAAIGPISVASTAQKSGVGRLLMNACLAEADRRGFRSVRLCNIAANPAAFALYHSIGFRAVESLVHCVGLIDPKHKAVLEEERLRLGLTVRPMRAEDLPLCDRLHVATNSFSRLPSLTYAFHAQRAERTKGKVDEQKNAAPDEPFHALFVAVDSHGHLVGYNDGYDVDSHWIGESEAVVVQLLWRMSEELRAVGASKADILVLSRRNGELIDRLTRLGVKILRQVVLMNRGEYVEPHRFVYCASIMW